MLRTPGHPFVSGSPGRLFAGCHPGPGPVLKKFVILTPKIRKIGKKKKLSRGSQTTLRTNILLYKEWGFEINKNSSEYGVLFILNKKLLMKWP